MFSLGEKMDKVKANNLSPVVLAFVGDAVYSLFVREKLVFEKDCKPGELNKLAVKSVKATAQAKKAMRKIALVGKTISHETVGKFGRGSIVMLPAEEGTGVIAGGPVRAVMEAAGVKDIRTKSHGTTNPINMVKAALEGLYGLKSAEDVAALRGKTVEEVLG